MGWFSFGDTRQASSRREVPANRMKMNHFLVSELPAQEDRFSFEPMLEIHQTPVEIVNHAAERADPVELDLKGGDRAFEEIFALGDARRKIAEPRGDRVVAQALDLVCPR